ncbi:MAG: hypothetical protein KDA86_25615 [Planctomycetaceae bacterium]|nr:hypothetical protein [Planctomycetaceae bacterium]
MASVSTRTPEGEPRRCEICGALSYLEVSSAGDTLCPRCGVITWELCALFNDAIHVPVTELSLDLLDQVARHSLDLVELVMAIEDKWRDELGDREVTEAETIRQLVRWIREGQRDLDDRQFGPE